MKFPGPAGFRGPACWCALRLASAQLDVAAHALRAHARRACAFLEIELAARAVFALGLGLGAEAVLNVARETLDLEVGIGRLLALEHELAADGLGVDPRIARERALELQVAGSRAHAGAGNLLEIEVEAAAHGVREDLAGSVADLGITAHRGHGHHRGLALAAQHDVAADRL